MCRLFGFRSIINSQVHESLIKAENALQTQSNRHPDGWGVAYYIDDSPHLIRSNLAAIEDSLFAKVSGVVSSDTVLAHLRKATHGSCNILNTHPFQYGRWTFAHNGNIKDFEKVREKIEEKINPELKRFVLGETDSEILFYFLLSYFKEHGVLADTDFSVDLQVRLIRQALQDLMEIVGEYSKEDDAGDTENYFTFIITNGHSMIAHQGGKHLYYSTYKVKCKDRDICSSFSPNCEAESLDGKVNHAIFSSEPLHGENVWIGMAPGEMIGIDQHMQLRIFKKI
jgi:predicted glutamine amidotransferase